MIQFKTLAEAENYLLDLGFHLVPDTCDWTNEAGDDAGCYAKTREPYGVIDNVEVVINRRS